MHDYLHTSVRTDTGQGRVETQARVACRHPWLSILKDTRRTFWGPPFCLPLPAVAEGLKQTHDLLGSVWKPVGGNDCSSDFN